MPKVFLYPPFREPDQGEGGIRRVVEAQRKYLPEFGIELVDKDTEADIIAAHAILPPTYWKKYPEKLFVEHCHGLYWGDLPWDAGHKSINHAVLASIRACDMTTAPTEWVAQAIRRHSNRAVLTVPHGIDLEDWGEPQQHEGFVYWDKSRVDLTCDPKWLNELVARLPAQQFVSTFGDPAANMTLIGKVPHAQAKSVMQRAGVYLATSRETGQGMSVLEALASGVPVVGYRWGGVADTIQHKRSGWLAEPGDVAGLAEGIAWCLENRDAVMVNARARATRYSWRDAVSMYAEMYKGLAEVEAMRQVKVSIVVRARDMEPWLSQTLDSVLAQTFADWECLVVDDASSDQTRAIAESYAGKDGRFRVLHNEQGVGPGEAHNVGFRAARGKYFMSLDADDRFAGGGALAVLVGLLDKDREIHAVYGNVEFEEPDGRRWHSSWPIQTDVEKWFEQQQVGQPMPYCTLMRREVWDYTGGYRSRCRTSEDQDFWLRASSYGFIAKYATQMDVLLYRNRQGSLTSREGFKDWRSWYPWRESFDVIPAAAVTDSAPVVHSCDPPLVSVVIPCGPGHAKYVKDAVDSVDAQTFRLWECIVVNDSGEQLELPQWCRVLEVRSEEWTQAVPVGVAHARNRGIEMAKGRLILPLDADDFLQPNCLMEMVRAFRSGEGAPLIYSDFWENPSPNFDEYKVYRTPDFDPDSIIKGAIHPVTCLFPKELWEKVGGYDEEIIAWEDWDFQFKYLELGWPARRVAAPLWTYRKDTGQRAAANHDDFERSREAIWDRWIAYWRDKKMTGCSSCGSKNRTTYPMAPAPSAAMVAGDANAGVYIEHLGSQVSTWKGVTPGIPAYRFQPKSVHLVAPRDAEHFLQFPDSFARAGADSTAPTAYEMPAEMPLSVGAGRALQEEHTDRPIARPPRSSGNAGTPLAVQEVPATELANMVGAPERPAAPAQPKGAASEASPAIPPDNTRKNARSGPMRGAGPFQE